jgi:6-phosphofructokinase 1
MKKIALITSGGDAPGMNAALRALVRKGIYSGYQVCGIQRGFSGLLNGNPVINFELGSVADIIQRGGTFLLTARAPEMYEEKYQVKAAEHLKKEGVDCLVVIGGEGSFKGAMTIEKQGIQTICIPGTIDNDINGTDQTIGFDTAVNTILDAVNRIRDTASSHERVFLLEVMGRQTGYLALIAGLAGGAESILVPEIEYNLTEICRRIKRGIKRDKAHSIIIVAEGAADIYELNDAIRNQIDVETRVTVLGHLQRGGSPSAVDRLLGSRMGSAAVDWLTENKSGYFTALKGQDIIPVPLDSCFAERKPFPEDLYRLALVLSR